MKFVGVIPARGGSKGIYKKNIALCAGEPLLAYTCREALATGQLDRVILSTDDDEIAQVGRSLGVEVSFQRPKELATDDTPMIAVLQHALDWLTRKFSTPDAIVLLQPTSPLRKREHITEALGLFMSSGAASVVSVVKVPHQFAPSSILQMHENGHVRPYLSDTPLLTRRQDKSVVYARNGPAVLVVSSEVVRSGRLYGEPTMGYIMSAEDSIDVDSLDDLRVVEVILKQRTTMQSNA